MEIRVFTPKRIVFLASVTIFLSFVFVFWDYSIDDAFITFKYSENLANGYGLVHDPGQDPVEGYSNFLWLLLLALAYKLGLPIYATAKVTGILSFLVAAGIWFRHFREDDAELTWLVGPFLLICPCAAFWGVCGLELGLHTLLIAWATTAFLRRSSWLHVSLLLIVLSRPEGIGFGLSLLAIGALSDFFNRRLDKRYIITAVAVLAAAAAGLFLFRMLVFGFPLPNTYYAKMYHIPGSGYLGLARMLLMLAPFTAALVWGVVRVIQRKAADTELSICVVVFATQALIGARMDPVMNFLFRYLVPSLPLLFVVGLKAVSHFKRIPVRWLVVASALASLLVSLPQVHARVQSERLVVAAQQKFIQWARSLPEIATLSISDMGRIPYYTEQTYHDIYGLVDQETAHQGFNAPGEFLRLPDYFVLVGYVKRDRGEIRLRLRLRREQLIVQNDPFHDTYKLEKICFPDGSDPEEPGYYYLVFRRDNVRFFYDPNFRAYLKEHLDSAERFVLRILELVPDDMDAYHLLGSIYTEKKNYHKAKEVWKVILTLAPEDSVALHNLSRLEEQMR